MFQRIDPTLSVHPVPYRVMGLALGRQMIVLILPDGYLWIHSPVPVTPEVKAELARRGRVGHVVGPNRWHDECLESFQDAYPAAFFHAAPGLAAAKPSVNFLRTLSNEADNSWAAVVSQHVVAGMPGLNEVVFLHHHSRTLILADLAMNLGHDQSWLDRAWLRVAGVPIGRFGPSRACRGMMRDRAAVRASLQHLLAWDFDRIIVGHGRNIETGGKAALREAFSFLRLD